MIVGAIIQKQKEHENVAFKFTEIRLVASENVNPCEGQPAEEGQGTDRSSFAREH